MRFATIQQTFFFGLLTLVTIAFLWLIRDFIFPIFWAIVFAILFYPLNTWWLARTNLKPTLSSILTIATIILLIFTPLFVIGSLTLAESIQYYQQFSANNLVTDGISILDRAIAFAGQFESLGIDQNRIESVVLQAAKGIGDWLTSQAIAFGQNIFRFVLLFFIMLYILFFLFRDGTYLEKRLLKVLPLGDKKEKRLIARFVSTTRATIKGTFVIAVIQGTIGGLLFWVVGINAPLVWGILMGLLSVIPAVGPAIIWLPAGLILLFTGNIWQGVVILVIGGVVITFIDNLLRPPLVGKDTQMPDVLILLSTLGGLTLFGITGFIIGPIIAAFFLSMWTMFEEEFEKELEKYG